MLGSYFNSRPLYRGRLIRQLDYMITLIFQLTPPIQRATIKPSTVCAAITFQLTPPIQRATHCMTYSAEINQHFNSRPLYRGRLMHKMHNMALTNFNSRPLYRGRRDATKTANGNFRFQLTPPIQRATNGKRINYWGYFISTHAPYTEGDRF